jgi:hypothetical protein
LAKASLRACMPRSYAASLSASGFFFRMWSSRLPRSAGHDYLVISRYLVSLFMQAAYSNLAETKSVQSSVHFCMVTEA